MSTYEHGRRIGVTASRVREIELAEARGSIKMSVLDRIARSLNCRLIYVLVPNESLDEMVMRQARHQAERVLASSNPGETADPGERGVADDGPFPSAVEVEVLANQLSVLQGLWTEKAKGG
jgi:transcriptional regulator with XRE-family HTH domain